MPEQDKRAQRDEQQFPDTYTSTIFAGAGWNLSFPPDSDQSSGFDPQKVLAKGIVCLVNHDEPACVRAAVERAVAASPTAVHEIVVRLELRGGSPLFRIQIEKDLTDLFNPRMQEQQARWARTENGGSNQLRHVAETMAEVVVPFSCAKGASIRVSLLDIDDAHFAHHIIAERDELAREIQEFSDRELYWGQRGISDADGQSLREIGRSFTEVNHRYLLAFARSNHLRDEVMHEQLVAEAQHVRDGTFVIALMGAGHAAAVPASYEAVFLPAAPEVLAMLPPALSSMLGPPQSIKQRILSKYTIEGALSITLEDARKYIIGDILGGCVEESLMQVHLVQDMPLLIPDTLLRDLLVRSMLEEFSADELNHLYDVLFDPGVFLSSGMRFYDYCASRLSALLAMRFGSDNPYWHHYMSLEKR